MTIQEAKDAIKRWLEEEYGEVETEPMDEKRVPVAYTVYEDYAFVYEQWYVDLVEKAIYCELDDTRVPDLDERYGSIESLIDSLDFNRLIGESDYYIEEHLEDFEKDEFEYVGGIPQGSDDEEDCLPRIEQLESLLSNALAWIAEHCPDAYAYRNALTHIGYSGKALKDLVDEY